ncbi:unknown [Clostridium sp. CAG:221]|jgi:hypothetical protein|uniref:hypothetical protein n=1 Tax=Clostridium sp. CAG:221 TaxID=1262780 RepID=UPI000338CAB0|nr:hypothetical protein [Clostridium sp. CAG:221]CDB16182.1 unknown [Clostridium sp. CAG:221]
MLLTDINSIILKINNIDVNVIINFKTLENLYHFLKDDYLRGVIAIDCNDPFKFIEKIDSENNILNYVSVLIFCMADGKIQLSDIAEGLLKFEENEFNELVKILKITIINQLLFIEKSEKVNKKSEIKDSEYSFEDYFNYFYITATRTLNYSLEEFYNLTPAKLKQIININNDNKKNLLLSVAADIVSAIFKDSKNTKKDEVIIVKDANAFFDAI